MSVERLDPDDPASAARWDALVTRSQTPDAFFRPGFVRAHRFRPEDQALALLVTSGARAVLVPLVMRRVPGDAGLFDARTPADSGGVLPVDEKGPLAEDEARALVSALSAWCAENRVTALFLVLHPLLDQPAWFKAAGSEVCRLLPGGVTMAIELSSYDETERQLAGVKWERRRDLKRARAFANLEWASDQPDPDGARRDRFIGLFIELYEQTLKRLGANEWWFYPRAYYEALFRDLDGRLDVAVAFREGVPVGAATIVGDRLFAHGHLMGVTDEARKAGLPTLLYTESAAWAKRRGCRLLSIGGGMSPGDTLWQFKHSFRAPEFPEGTLVVVGDRALYEKLRADPPDAFPYPSLD